MWFLTISLLPELKPILCRGLSVLLKDTVLLVLFGSLHPNQQFFSHVGTVFLSWTSTKQHIKCLAQWHITLTSLTVRLKTSNTWIPSLMLYQLSHCTPYCLWWVSNQPFFHLKFNTLPLSYCSPPLYVVAYSSNNSKIWKL